MDQQSKVAAWELPVQLAAEQRKTHLPAIVYLLGNLKKGLASESLFQVTCEFERLREECLSLGETDA